VVCGTLWVWVCGTTAAVGGVVPAFGGNVSGGSVPTLGLPLDAAGAVAGVRRSTVDFVPA
jgi:hypothetical protein